MPAIFTPSFSSAATTTKESTKSLSTKLLAKDAESRSNDASAAKSFRQTLQHVAANQRSSARGRADDESSRESTQPSEPSNEHEPAEKSTSKSDGTASGKRADRAKKGSAKRQANKAESTEDASSVSTEETSADSSVEQATSSTEDSDADMSDSATAEDADEASEPAGKKQDAALLPVDPTLQGGVVQPKVDAKSDCPPDAAAAVSAVGPATQTTSTDQMSGAAEGEATAEASGKAGAVAGGKGTPARPTLRPREAHDADEGEGAATGTADKPAVTAEALATATDVADDSSFVEKFAETFEPESKTSTSGAKADLPQAPMESAATQSKSPVQTQATKQAAEPAPPPAPDFAAANHARIASSVKGELLPNGGSMQLRLDPPELGSLQVSLHLKDGVVTASFQTQNDDAARLLSHSLSDLRSSLEAHGITVDRLHVQQTPRDESSGSQGGNERQSQASQQQENRRDQQRKEMVQRLWDRLAGKEPLDLVA